ncbi:hypothetical protein E4U58_007216 [Claviceps cyperi]|nr:hypothetical protein E4U58_007216 [Claviceps cyperi]
MLSQLSRATRATSAVVAVARAARGNAIQSRCFIAPTISRRADFVQELYLKELKAYKTPIVKESDAEGHVQTFTMPKTPASPEESDLASNLQEYEQMAVETEGGMSADQGEDGNVELPDWLELEEDEAAH